MKNILDYNKYVEIINICESEEAILEFLELENILLTEGLITELEKSDIDSVNGAGRRGTAWSAARIWFWITALPVMAIRELIKWTQKKNNIEELVADEKDPKKKEALTTELKKLKAEQVKILAQIQKAKDTQIELAKKNKDKEAKAADEAKAKKNKEEYDKLKEELAKLKEAKKK
jgi:hypothetical protein